MSGNMLVARRVGDLAIGDVFVLPTVARLVRVESIAFTNRGDDGQLSIVWCAAPGAAPGGCVELASDRLVSVEEMS
jgi:hypothetical protein